MTLQTALVLQVRHLHRSFQSLHPSRTKSPNVSTNCVSGQRSPPLRPDRRIAHAHTCTVRSGARTMSPDVDGWRVRDARLRRIAHAPQVAARVLRRHPLFGLAVLLPLAQKALRARDVEHGACRAAGDEDALAVVPRVARHEHAVRAICVEPSVLD
eukprot:930214-Prymnesium_polylepis.2